MIMTIMMIMMIVIIIRTMMIIVIMMVLYETETEKTDLSTSSTGLEMLSKLQTLSWHFECTIGDAKRSSFDL